MPVSSCPQIRARFASALALALTMASAAGAPAAQVSEQTSSSSTAATRHLSKEEFEALRQQWKEEAAVAAEVQAEDRKELVLPPPPGFKPAPEAKRLQLTLRLRDEKIKVGQPIWYQLELRNIGSKNVRIWERTSFLKRPFGSYGFDWQMFVTRPDGSKKRVAWGDPIRMEYVNRPTRPVEIPDSKRMTEKEVDDYLRRVQWREKAQRNMDLTLAPGEAVVSRPWRWVDYDEYMERFNRGEKELRPKPNGKFTELFTNFKFKEPGRYGFQVILRNPSSHLNEKSIKKLETWGLSRQHAIEVIKESKEWSLGIIPSNVATFQVER